MAQDRDPYTPRRLVLMASLAAALAPLVYLAGCKEAAAGIVAGAPVAVLNYRMSYMAQAMTKASQSPKSASLLWMVSMLRMLFDVIALTAAAFLGGEFVLGVLVGLLLELATYYVDAASIIVSVCRGESGWKKKSKN